MTIIWNHFPVRVNAFSLNSEKRASNADMSPFGVLCFDIFPPPPGESEVISHVERLSSKEMKIAPISVRIALGASGRSDIACMVISRVGACNRTLPERRPLSTSPWDLLTAKRDRKAALRFLPRAIRRVARPTLGFKSFRSAAATLAGVELMHMIRKGQLRTTGKLCPAKQFY